MPTAANLIEVFSHYDGNVVFQELTDPGNSAGAVLGRVGWIFTALGAVFALWGFNLRIQQAGPGERVSQVARTWILLALMAVAPLGVRSAMQAADQLYASTIGGPANLAFACVRAAYILPTPLALLDPPPAAAAAPAPVPDGSFLGAVRASLGALWQGAGDTVGEVTGQVTGLMRVASLASGLYATAVRTAIVLVTFIPICLLFLASAGVIWFMDLLRFFLAVVATMMLPLFLGMFAMPDGHPHHQAARAYVMNLLSLALWPVAWMIGHTGTIVLFDVLASLIAGSGRSPDLLPRFSWAALSHPVAATSAQLQAEATALGNWLMGDLASLLAVLVGAIGFVLWVFTVTIAGPILLHRTLSAGELYFSQAMAASRQAALTTGSLALSAGKLAGLPAASLAPIGRGGAPDPERMPAAASAVQPPPGAASLDAAAGLP